MKCYVVAAPDADKAKIENEIKTMENYFVGYETVVNFISQEELDPRPQRHSMVASFFALVKALRGTRHVGKYSLKLDSNPEFTGSALVAYARGIYRLAKHGGTGCFTQYSTFHQLGSPHIPLKITSSLSIRPKIKSHTNVWDFIPMVYYLEEVKA